LGLGALATLSGHAAIVALSAIALNVIITLVRHAAASAEQLAIFTALVPPGAGTRQGRSAPRVTLTHNPPLLLRNACGSRRRPGRRAIVPDLSWCQDGRLRRPARAAAPVARWHGLRDSRRRSPAAKSSSRRGDRRGRRAPGPRRSRRGPSLQKSALTA